MRSVPTVGRDLVLAHLAGDPDAFDDIVRRYYPALLAHARRRLFDDRLAEDAVQETFLKAYRALPGFSGEYQLGAWLHRIVNNVCNDEGARRNRESYANERWAALVEPVGAGPEEYGERQEVRARVAAAVDKLPANYREALVLRDVMDYEYADVAVAAGISEDNARARVSRARAALRRLVEGSVALGGAFVGGFKRAGRWLPKLGYHLSNSPGVTDAAVSSARTGPMITLATTGVAAAAVVVASAVPLLGASSRPAPTKPPAAFAVTAGPQAPASTGAPVTFAASGVTSASAAVLVAPTTSTSTSTSTTTSTTSTTVAPTRTKGGSSVGVAVPPVRSTLDPSVLSGAIQTDPGSTEGPAELTIGRGAAISGYLTSDLSLPVAGGSVCGGTLTLKFVWSVPGTARPAELNATTSFVSASTGSGPTVYAVAGAGELDGDGQLDGPLSVTGSLEVLTGGAAQLSASLEPGPGAIAACEGDSPAATSTTSTLPALTTLPPVHSVVTVPPVKAARRVAGPS